MGLLRAPVRAGVIKVAILDGVLYISGRHMMAKALERNNRPILSALLLREFLEQV